jgi:squalene-hopene/tetraprenyl-beta-curcumene cyclase
MLAHIPFADFMTPLDPVSADVTAHAVELLARLGYSREYPALHRALDYLYGEQEEDGSWYGRWGVNYVYGTAAVLAALREVGDDPQGERMRRAARWLKEHQNDDGGWGETCRSYEDASYRGVGPSTASQTAWALLGLLAAGEEQDVAVTRGVEYAKMVAGMRRRLRGPAFLAPSTSGIICTRCTFP